jgi:hypothetical protein
VLCVVSKKTVYQEETKGDKEDKREKFGLYETKGIKMQRK